MTTQERRRARSREALLSAAARGLSRDGYRGVRLEQVAADAGYSRGAIYHQFPSKEALALAVIEWVDDLWQREVLMPAAERDDALEMLVAVARGHVVLCRRDIARVAMSLRVEFAGQEHPVGRAVADATDRILELGRLRIEAGRAAGELPDGPDAAAVAGAMLGAVEGIAIQLGPESADAEDLAERVVRALLGAPREGTA